MRGQAAARRTLRLREAEKRFDEAHGQAKALLEENHADAVWENRGLVKLLMKSFESRGKADEAATFGRLLDAMLELRMAGISIEHSERAKAKGDSARARG